MREIILKHIKNPNDLVLLEIGCGTGRFGKLLSNSFKKYCGIDINKNLVEEAQKNDPNSEYKIGSAENIPYDKEFDVLLFSLSFHMIKDKQKALDEARRVLEDDGIIVILEPSKRTKKWKSPKLKQKIDEIVKRKRPEDVKFHKAA